MCLAYARHFFLKTGGIYRNTMTRLIVLTVSIVLLWSVSGHVLWSIARQACYNYVHHIKKERSFRDTLVLANEVFNDANKLVWIKKDEIRYEGRMFDIKKQVIGNRVTVLIGHYDDFEHHLYKYLGKLFDDDNPPAKQTNKHWHTFIAILPDGRTTEHIYILTSLVHACQWANQFHSSVAIPPLHSPPDGIIT